MLTIVLAIGFAYEANILSLNQTVVYLAVVPCVFLIPAIVLDQREERLRRQSGPLCPQCGYDLLMTIKDDRERCPECGQPIDLKDHTNGSQ